MEKEIIISWKNSQGQNFAGNQTLFAEANKKYKSKGSEMSNKIIQQEHETLMHMHSGSVFV